MSAMALGADLALSSSALGDADASAENGGQSDRLVRALLTRRHRVGHPLKPCLGDPVLGVLQDMDEGRKRSAQGTEQPYEPGGSGVPPRHPRA